MAANGLRFNRIRTGGVQSRFSARIGLIFVGAFMTSPLERARDGRHYERRFVWAGAALVVLLLILVALGLGYSLSSRNKICAPSNPHCGRLPPVAAPALLPGQGVPPQ
jgi:hypothetical protein